MQIKSLKEVAQKDFKTLNKYQNGEITPIKTNRTWLDSVFGGLLPGDIVTIGGASGSGKSFELQRVRNNIMDKTINNEASKYVYLDNSLEMRNLNVIVRDLDKRLGKNKKQILTEKFTEEEKVIVEDYYKQITDDRFFINEETATSSTFLSSIDSFIESHKDKKAVFVNIDHMALLKDDGDGKKGSIDSVIEGINELKKKYNNVYFILLSQLNRNLASRSAERSNFSVPQRSDFYASDTIYHISDYIYVTHIPYKLGISSYLKVNKSIYSYLEGFFGEESKGKVSFDTIGKVFYHILKAREADVMFNDIYIEEVRVPDNYIASENTQTDIEKDFENKFE